MLIRPSARRKTAHGGIQLNLVPFIDAMVTMIGFMLFTISFIAIVSVESPFPIISQQDMMEKLKERPIQLTLTIKEKETEIWSPFEKIKSRTIPHMPSGLPDTTSIHSVLLEVKQQFPLEKKIVLVPTAQTNYDTLISLMDSMRLINTTDPPIYAKNPATGLDEVIKDLFPEVVFGNLLGDS
ncbi:MAG: biopolymer transporter ExbD [Bdellovibrionota bacterium]